MCNHVVFVAPLLAPTQYDYESMMKQAVGRAFRYGQPKPIVHVYHFATMMTTEVNILEMREKGVLVDGADNEEQFIMAARSNTLGKARYTGEPLQPAAAGDEDDSGDMGGAEEAADVEDEEIGDD